MYAFGATLGTSAADRIQLSVTPTTGARTYAFRGTINAGGGGGLGRFLDAEPTTATTEAWFRQASNNTIIYNRKHYSAGAAWSCPCPADVSGEHTYSISVDGTTASPQMYFDGVSQTVTVGTAAVGGAVDITAPIYLGNRSPDWGRGYDGGQRGWAIWNAILTPQEHLDFHNGADPKSNTGWTSGVAPAGFVCTIPMEAGNVDPDGVIVAVTGAKLIAAQQDATVTLTGQAYALTQGSLAVGSNITLGLTGQSYALTQGTLSASATGGTIAITSPVANQLFRRGSNATISMPVTVTYTGSPQNIEARFNGGAWQSFAATGSPQTFNIANCARGYGAIDVRFAENTTIAASRTPVAVGKSIAIMGQSNASGRGTTNQTAPAAGAYLFTCAGTFAPLADPFDGGTQLYGALNDAALAGGSYAPRLAQDFLNDGEPTLMIPVSYGGTTISQWVRQLSTGSLYGAAKAQIDAAGGADIIVWHLGESDARAGTLQATYQTALTTLVGQWRSDFGNPLCLIQQIQIEAGYEAAYSAIRAAQFQVGSKTTGAKVGGDLAGITTDLHFWTTAELTAVADRTYAAYTSAATLISPEDRGNIALALSSLTNETTNAPTVTMQVRTMANEQDPSDVASIPKNYFFYGQANGVTGKTPTFKMKFWSSSTHSASTEIFKFHYTTPLDVAGGYKPKWSYDARTWNFFDHCAWNADGLYLDFYNDAAFTGDTVYFATSDPWQTDKTAEWIASLSSPYLSQPPSAVAYGGDPYQFGITTARTNELGETIAPVKCYALRISTPGNDPNGHPKKHVVLTAGTHAGEDAGNWSLKGAVEFLLSESPKAVTARAWNIYEIYPETDGSGRRGGQWRSHFDPAKLTADGNRYWGLTTLANTVLHQNAITLDTGGSFVANFDFHGGHAGAHYIDSETQASNSTWSTAINAIRPGIVINLGDIAHSCMGWGEASMGGVINITPETNWIPGATTTEFEQFGADIMSALSDVSASGYLAPYSVAVSLVGQSYAHTQGVLNATVGSNVTLTLIGQSYTYLQGLAGKAIQVGLQGQSYSSIPGALSASIGNNVTISLSGQNYALSQGLVGKSLDVGLQGQYISFTQGSLSAVAGSNYFITLSGQDYLHGQGNLGVSVSYPQPSGTVTLSQESIDALATAIANAMYAHPNAVTEGGIVSAVWNKVL